MDQLFEIAQRTLNPIKLKKYGEAGHVACALESASGKIYTGICIDVPCSLGCCAEQAAIAEMLKDGETRIRKIVAVDETGSILPPCGRCRELMSQLDAENMKTIVALGKQRQTTLQNLLPERWDKKWD